MNKDNKLDNDTLQLKLKNYLTDYHPDLMNDIEFIKTRAKNAWSTYFEAIEQGLSMIEADDEKNNTLYEGLYFSKFVTVRKILHRDDINDLIESKDIKNNRKLALEVLEKFSSEFDKVEITEDFFDTYQGETFMVALKRKIKEYIVKR